MNQRTQERVEELKGYLRDLKEGKLTRPVFLTHMGEINLLLCAAMDGFIQTSDTHYTASSLIHEFTFADGKKYRVEISEVRTKSLLPDISNMESDFGLGGKKDET